MKLLNSAVKNVKTYIPQSVKNLLRRTLDFLTWDQWAQRSWSQEGEDMVLRRIFERQKDGLYVDVGAHHPKRFSNTYLFYQRGWRGINIDAMPGSMVLFEKVRSRDINLELGVAKKGGSLDYYVFNETALNGFSAELSEERNSAKNSYYVKEVIKVDVKPLCEILDQYLAGRAINFLSVDVEGFDLDVLQSNDWSKYRPTFVLVEILNSVLYDLEQEPVARFMREQNYAIYAKQVNTIFFKDLT
jgi:FkbM family methyltransferase